MIWKLFIGLLVLATLIYYIFCFLEIFELIKFTDKDTKMSPYLALIPLYYLFKKGKKHITQKEN